MPSAGQSILCYRYRLSSGWDRFDTRVITEASVLLTVNGEPWLSFTCTPTNLDALAVGFLYNENVIQTRDEVAVLDICKQETTIDVWLNKTVTRPENWLRTSGCNGGLTALTEPLDITAVSTGEKIDPEALLDGMEQLFQVQEMYRETRGIHCSALSDGRAILTYAEDIGRHNTLDKLAGRVVLDGLPSKPVLLFTTGRVSSEMLQKSLRLGVQAVVSRTSPTSESINSAHRAGITLVGYARRSQMMVYTHPERLVTGSV